MCIRDRGRARARAGARAVARARARAMARTNRQNHQTEPTERTNRQNHGVPTPGVPTPGVLIPWGYVCVSLSLSVCVSVCVFYMNVFTVFSWFSGTIHIYTHLMIMFLNSGCTIQ